MALDDEGFRQALGRAFEYRLGEVVAVDLGCASRCVSDMRSDMCSRGWH